MDRPRCTAENALIEGTLNSPVHSVEAGVAENDYLIVMNAYHIREKLLSLGDTVEHTVISYVNAVLAEEIAVIEHVKHTHAELELLLAGISS